MILRLKRAPGIYLVGFMGSGKSTVGKALAERLGWSYADLDEDIVMQENCPIATIFEERGEAEFRRIEREVLQKRVRQISIGRPTIVALGGGTFAQADNVDLISQHGITVWLDCPFELIKERVTGTDLRPLARDAERFQALYDARRESYARADCRLEVTGNNVEETVNRIQAMLEPGK